MHTCRAKGWVKDCGDLVNSQRERERETVLKCSVKASEEALVREEAELKARRIDEMVRSKKNWVALQDLKKKNSTGQVTLMYSNFCNYAPPLDEKQGIFAEKNFPLFSENCFGACFGLVIFIGPKF